METTQRWSPIHGYLLVTLLGVALASPVLLAPRSASARGEPQATAAAPAGKPERRTLSVQGTAEVLTTPDEVMIQFRIDSFDRSLKASKRDNDAKTRNALATLEKGYVKAGAVQTSDFTINPHHEHAPGVGPHAVAGHACNHLNRYPGAPRGDFDSSDLSKTSNQYLGTLMDGHLPWVSSTARPRGARRERSPGSWSEQRCRWMSRWWGRGPRGSRLTGRQRR